MQGPMYTPPAADDIVLFVESEDWCFYGDIAQGESREIESRDYVIIKYETSSLNELVKQLHENIGAIHKH